MKILKQTAFVLLLIGGLNWGLYGLSGYDLVDILLGSTPVIARIVYVLIGLATLYIILSKHTLCSCSSCTCDAHDGCECKVKIFKNSSKSETKTEV